MKQVSSKIKLDLAQYRELQSFAQFGSDLDEETQRILAHGERLREILKQPQYKPVDIIDQIVIIYTVVNKYLMEIPVDDIVRFEKEFLAYVDENYSDIKDQIRESEELTDTIEEKLKKIIEEFIDKFETNKSDDEVLETA
jgi:F-type H+-transporting ATPase subunit alpha